MRKTKGRPKTFDENEILELAMNYFWEHGYENSSLDELLKVMNIKKSSFYHTFKNKEELFSKSLALYKDTVLKHLKELKNEVGAKKTMSILVESTIKELKDTGKVKGCLLMNSGKECYKKHDNLSNQISFEYNFMQDFFFEIIQEAKEKKEITSKMSAKSISGRFMNSLNGLVLTIQAGANEELINDIVESLKDMLE
jgi:AcrR family transcriptional regulator